MAFYTSRVDNDGNELERRHSGRSAGPLHSSSTTYISQNTSKSLDGRSSVRYVNSAAYIEKTDMEDSDISSLSTDFKVKSSICSDGPSNIVPPLDLAFEENSPTTNGYTFSCRKTVQTPNVAFETWLSAKRKVMSDEAARRKKLEEEQQREKEERKRLAHEKFKEWVQAKKQMERNKTPPTCEQEDAELYQQLSEQEVRARLHEWEQKKRFEEEQKRMIRREEEQRRREMEEERRHMAEHAWKKWVSEAASKPKPVPLNRGIFTLRGTISDIYVNPNEWKPIIPENEEN